MAEADTRLSEWIRKHDVNEEGENGITLLASSIANGLVCVCAAVRKCNHDRNPRGIGSDDISSRGHWAVPKMDLRRTKEHYRLPFGAKRGADGLGRCDREEGRERSRAMILVANDPQTHVASSIKRNYAKTCKRTGFCLLVDVGTFATTNGSEEAGLDRALLLRNSTLTACSHSIAKDHWLAFGDIPSLATGRDSWGIFFTCDKNLVAYFKTGVYDFGLGLKTAAMLIREVRRFSNIHEAFQGT
ncbi:hypothetical protein BGY98DRAFT_936670 [Russula aff. rugulosa BPL654]|nr:hypothetical protein BGY98DRAFT_936670 [Russula aff. rugulosa BPL654]